MNQDLKKDYKEFKHQYHENKDKIKLSKKTELTYLKEEYKINRIAILKPLKKEKYARKIQKRRINRSKNEPPKRTTLEEIGNSITHGIGALLGILFLILMINKSHNGFSLAAAIIYGLCFTLQMLFSCLYHSFKSGTTIKRILRRFDYSSIYLQIGGTFAPLYLIYMQEKMYDYPIGLIFCLVQWFIIIVGITFVGVFGPGRLRGLHFTLYFALGWSAVLFFPTFFKYDIPLFLYLLAGGLVYTLGMIPFAALRGKKSAHFIWHFAVLLGAILQWIGIFLYVF